jgi:hypothetical protein
MCDSQDHYVEYFGVVVDIDHNQSADISDPNGSKILISMPWSTACVGDEVKVLLKANVKGQPTRRER